jgi:hypothetical protein
MPSPETGLPVPGDIVKLVEDWAPVERAAFFVVLSEGESPVHGDCFTLARVENFPGATYPRGRWSYTRAVPKSFVVLDYARTKAWKEARDEPPYLAE